MRSILITTMAVAAFCVATSCQKEATQDSPRSHVRKITVHADQAATRTEITYDETAQKYKSVWDEEDWIDLFEFSNSGFCVGNSQVDRPVDGERPSQSGISGQFLQFDEIGMIAELKADRDGYACVR